MNEVSRSEVERIDLLAESATTDLLRRSSLPYLEVASRYAYTPPCEEVAVILERICGSLGDGADGGEMASGSPAEPPHQTRGGLHITLTRWTARRLLEGLDNFRPMPAVRQSKRCFAKNGLYRLAGP